MRAEDFAGFPLLAAGPLMMLAAAGLAVVAELVARRILSHQVRVDHNVMTAAMFTVTGTTYAGAARLRRDAGARRLQPRAGGHG